MRKLFVMAIMIALVMGTVVADPGTGESHGDTLADITSTPATLEVTLDLSGDLANHYQVGFANTDITEANYETAATDSVKLTTLGMDTTGSNGEISNSDTAYVYYVLRIPATQTVNITLKINEKLKSTSDSSGIEWTATANSATAEVGGEAKTITSVTGNGKLQVEAFPLMVSTKDLLNTAVKTEAYSGMLTLSISSN